MTPDDIKRYFETTPPPKEVDWKPWARVFDSQTFLNSCYIGIRNFNGPIERCPAWWHLKDFYLLMKRNAPQENGPENQPEIVEES